LLLEDLNRNNTIALEKLEGEITSNLYFGINTNTGLKMKLRQVGLAVLFLVMILFVVLTLLTKDIIIRELLASIAIILGLMIIKSTSVSVENKH
jgi:hypothetical protein